MPYAKRYRTSSGRYMAGPIIRAGLKYRYGQYGVAAAKYGPAAYAIGKAFLPKYNSRGSLRGTRYSKGRYKAKPRKTQFQKLKGKVKKMEQRNELASHTFRLKETQFQTASHGQANYYTTDVINAANIKTALANFRYFDPAAPATLVGADRSTGTYSRDIWVDQVHSKFHLVNNYTMPCKITLYRVSPKEATSLTPTQAMDQGLADQAAPANRSPSTYPTDSDLFNSIYRIDKSYKCWLQPGQHKKFTHATGGFQFNVSEFDSESASYQPRHKAFHWYVRIVGPITHSSSTQTEIGHQTVSVDMMHEIKYVFKYDAGVELNDFSLTDNSRVSAYTTGGVLVMRNIEHHGTSRSDADA